MAALDSLEGSLDKVFGKNAPKLPESGRNSLVEWMPWLSLIIGVLSLWGAYTLWHWAHIANGLVDYANQLSQIYGGDKVVANRLTAGIWLGLIILAVEAVLYLMAYQPLKKRQKAGWNLLFYALLLNVAYAVVLLFTDYGGFIGPLVGAIIGFWLLFQIRPKYTAK